MGRRASPSRASRDDAGRDDDGARWRLEDGIGATRARLCGALLFALGVAVFVGATIAALSFVDGEADDAFRYYSLIVPVTLPPPSSSSTSTGSPSASSRRREPNRAPSRPPIERYEPPNGIDV